MNINGMEIERKYLIAMPDAAVLQSADASEIVQTYLVNRRRARLNASGRAHPAAWRSIRIPSSASSAR